MAATTMRCVSCNTVKAYPDAFPTRSMAEYWECAWMAHIRTQHGSVIRKVKRTAKRRARRLKTAEIESALLSHEARLVLGPTSPTAARTDLTATTTEERTDEG